MTDDPIQTNDDAMTQEPLDELEVLRAEIEQLKAASLIERADLENQRRRLGRELEAARKFANERLLGDLLPVADSLEAGLRAGGVDPARLAEGMAATLRLFDKALEKHGLETIEPQGQPFNPELHQAMSLVDGGGVAPGTVVTVFQKGYRLNDRLLRPAMVAVARDAED